MESPSLSTVFFLLLIIPINLSNAGISLDILNNCSYTVWPAAFWLDADPVGGGRKLDHGQSWTLELKSPGSLSGRIWGRTGCSFDDNGNGRCQTGDCGGLLECNGTGAPPNTLAEFSLGQVQSNDFYDISLVDGFNVPLELSPASRSCRGMRCAADITARCPAELKAPGGCNSPCTVFKTSEYCCTGNHSSPSTCRPTNYSKFFESSCPDAYSYPFDDATSTSTCPTGGDYRIVFCPSGGTLPDDGLTTEFGRVVVSLVIPEI